MKSELAPLIPYTPGWLGKNQLPFHEKYHGKGVCFAGSSDPRSSSHYVLDWLWECGQITLCLLDMNFFDKYPHGTDLKA